MTALIGYLESPAIYPASAGINAAAYDNRTPPLTSYAAGYAGAPAMYGAATRNQPIAVYSTTRGAVRARSFVDDWYNRIHISQGTLSLGNVVSSVTQTISVWNAWLENSRTLTTISSSGSDGISYTGPGNPPIVFAPNQQRDWAFTVALQGPPTIAASFRWTFNNGETVELDITGSRITAWAITPDWANGVRERFEFKTDVFQAWSGAEMRRALRISPRRIFEFDVQLNGMQRHFAEAELFAWSAMVWALPIWPDGQRLTVSLPAGASSIPCDTVNRDFVAGGLAILIRDASFYEVVQITSVTSTALALTHPTANAWPRGSRLYPVRTARLVNYPSLTRLNGNFATARPQFVIVEPCDWAAATGLPQYRGYPVLENEPDDSASMNAQYERKAVTIDNGTGVITVDDQAQIGFPNWSHAWWLRGRSARAAFRSLLYLLRGRQGEIWVPSYQLDFKLAATIASSATTIDVEIGGYAQYLAGQQNRKDIRIELMNGTVFYRRVGGAVVVDANTERLSIDSSLGQQVTPAQVRRISFMTLCRLNSDQIDLLHYNMADGLATAVTPWRAVNHDV